MNAFSPLRSLGVVILFSLLGTSASASVVPCATCGPLCTVCVSDDGPPSWMFRRSTYSHDPESGARVAQYMRTPPVEPLEDERLVTSRYRRSRTSIRGADGSVDNYYEVQSWGNGRGGIDAEWERFHDAWKESYLQGGYYNQGPSYGNGHPGWGNGWGGNNGWGGGWQGGGNWKGGGWGGGGGPHGGGPGGGGPGGGGPGGGY